MIKIKRALISVTDKTGIVDFAKFLDSQKIEIISTGGTAKILKENNIKVKDISDFTGFPEIMDGRVKTLHPKVHGGLLGVRDNKEHLSAMELHDIEQIDMVIVNLYAFEETAKKNASFEETIENIDIGGPSMIRSAAKNHKFVAVVVNPERYSGIIETMKNNNNAIPEDVSKALAGEAFTRTASYDSAIATWFDNQLGVEFPEKISINAERKSILRYGENPHQKAAIYINDNTIPSVANAKFLQGKELSYNNILDSDSAYELVSEFQQPSAVIVKHNNPCGVASSENLAKAFEKALNCDPVSAFGGIFAFNREVDKETAEKAAKIFCEVIIAPSYTKEALEIFSTKKNLRVLEIGHIKHANQISEKRIQAIKAGFLLQDKDNIVLDLNNLNIVTKRKPTEREMEDLLFAFTICKHVKSNAIVYAKDLATIGIGAGQMSRIDSSRIGAWKAREVNKNSESAAGSVLASDAFFPFADGLEAGAAEGITAVIQPGGSVRDEEVIAAADKNNIAMVFTGIRHFRH
ncbi:MAG: bifunctional phosphoribosylaminoimidazolecarboxamide formyltransferase/IMP cyclohydrolase [Rickettsiales bacterium]|nr:bifunctional phosphoribosylaminoimidazolecarboxamide formyltransferase/IMP cyclohydrolase [Rickettsiales bacterium]